MSIAPEPISRPPVEHESRHVLRGVSWETYQKLREDNPSGCLRMTYDRGVLEILSPSRKHERVAYLLGRIIDHWTFEHSIAVSGGRNTTFSRKDLQRGLEPDNCYWITNEDRVRAKEEVDLTIDPPLDLVIEVDVTSSSIPKLPIYAELGVPEIWRWRHDVLEVLRLDAKGRYLEQKASAEIPKFPLKIAANILEGRHGKDDTAVFGEFAKQTSRRRR